MSVELPGGTRAPTRAGPPPPADEPPTRRGARTALERALQEASYAPDRFVDGLAPTLGRPEHHLQGFHFSTFNEVAGTEAWRQQWLARLSDAGTG